MWFLGAIFKFFKILTDRDKDPWHKLLPEKIYNLAFSQAQLYETKDNYPWNNCLVRIFYKQPLFPGHGYRDKRHLLSFCTCRICWKTCNIAWTEFEISKLYWYFFAWHWWLRLESWNFDYGLRFRVRLQCILHLLKTVF